MIDKQFNSRFISLGIIIVVNLLIRSVKSANILCIAPFPAISHYQMIEPLMVGLAGRGHQVTILSHFPQKEKVGNLTDIDLRGTIPLFSLDFTSWTIMDDMVELFYLGQEQCRMFAESKAVKNFLQTRRKFDLIFLEAFDSDCYLSLVGKYKAPFILFSAMALPVWISDWIYNPTEPSYVPDNLCRLSGKMNFFQRFQNTVCQLLFRLLHSFYNSRMETEKLFDINLQTLQSLKQNVSLILVNSFYGLNGVRPFFPNVLEIGGIHIKPPKPLPKDIESFLSGSPDGVIVISMGSIVQSHTLDPKVKESFLRVISRLKERVIWKWEAELPNKPSNLMTVKWLPQSDVLGHPKVKLFISHGGIHGVFEAVQFGVPIIGIPLFGDQLTNLKELELKGAAVVMNFASLNEENLSEAITQVLSNESYRENAKAVSKIFRDRPQTPLEKAMFWTEYVIRHKGAPHFLNGTSELSWLQYALLDVIFVLLSFSIPLIVVFHFSLKFLKNLIIK